jgi:hypothetical protein
LKLAYEWCKDSGVFTLEDYYKEVTPLMPTHIFRGKKRAPKINLAAAAFKRIDATYGFKNESGRLSLSRIKESAGQGSRWLVLSKGKDLISVNDYSLTNKEKDAFSKWLRYHGYKSRGKGVYERQGDHIQLNQSIDSKH